MRLEKMGDGGMSILLVLMLLPEKGVEDKVSGMFDRCK